MRAWLRDRERRAVLRFLMDAYYDHDIEPGDYLHLRRKLEAQG